MKRETERQREKERTVMSYDSLLVVQCADQFNSLISNSVDHSAATKDETRERN